MADMRDVYDSGQSSDEEEEEEYYVEAILGHKTNAQLEAIPLHRNWSVGPPDTVKFHVKWLHYEEAKDLSWEPPEALKNNEVYNKYCKQHHLSKRTGKPKHRHSTDTDASSSAAVVPDDPTPKRKRGRPPKVKETTPHVAKECPQMFDAAFDQTHKSKKHKKRKLDSSLSVGNDPTTRGVVDDVLRSIRGDDRNETTANAAVSAAIVAPVENAEMDVEDAIEPNTERPGANCHYDDEQTVEVQDQTRPQSTSSVDSGSSGEAAVDQKGAEMVVEAMNELNNTANDTLAGLKAALAEIINDHGDERCSTFLPPGDMGPFAYSLCADDDAGNITVTKKSLAGNAQYAWPLRLREAFVSGDAEFMKKTFDSWCSEVENKTAESRPEIEKRLILEMDRTLDNGLNDTSMLMAVSWERVSSGCSSASGHPWCGAQKMLIDAGIDVNKHTTQSQWTALMVAAKQGTLCQLATLLTHGADVMARTDDGLTALHFAVDRGYMTMVKWLVWHGADLNALGGCSLRSPVTLALQRSLGTDENMQNVSRWLQNRRDAVDKTLGKWVKMFDFLALHKQISSVHTWPVFCAGTGRSVRSFEIETPRSNNEQENRKPVLFITVRFVAAEQTQNDSTEAFTDKTVHHTALMPDLRVTLNGQVQTITYIDGQGWLAVLEPLNFGVNKVQLTYDRPPVTKFTKVRRTCALVAQPWLCELKEI